MVGSPYLRWPYSSAAMCKSQWQNVTNKRKLRNLLDKAVYSLSLIHISEPTRQAEISYAVFCLKKKKNKKHTKKKKKKK